MPRIKHAVPSAAVGLAALLLCAYPASATGDTDPSTKPGREEIIELVAKTTQNRFIDVDPSGPSQGDQFINSGDLFRDGEEVGTYGEVCTLTRTAPGDEFDLQCLATFSLPKGDLTVQGRFTVTGDGPEDDINFAITGGTEKYRTARGFVRADNTSETESELTVHLVY
ncbi:hypothetical protein ACFU5O_18655 [Streptomyces sp. NPDC057445]|uniref:allene oxide cyclase barrel-like domain-containing protein n=1 Tax=Streptomyces sp. NPDC057445 TaxID=3346136 RepID=UPI00368A902D